MTRIVLHIDRLLLRGIDPADADALAAALRQEVQRLLSVSGLPPLQEQPRRARRPDKLRLAADAGVQGLGQAVAASLVHGPQGLWPQAPRGAKEGGPQP
ncbi:MULTISPECIES: hypothetical protein [Pseudomonas]|uniref:hypothetical protein n=1 Tax=Pseudomonas TaxID=286 RepID=UPI0023D87153|nr:hypothetical protein [Pseudomonas sp. 273]